MTTEQLFFELIQVSLGTRICLSHTPSADEWGEMYSMAKKQSLVGVCFAGVQQLCNSSGEDYCGMNEMQYLTWMGMAAKIQQRNEVMNGYTQKALEYFREKGFACCALKGQVIASLYGNLAFLRQPGDIDVWLSCNRETLYRFAYREYGSIDGLNYHHIYCPIIPDCEVEAHVWPSYMTNPINNRRFHIFSKAHQPKGCENKPNRVFNGVFILLHFYRHFCGRGVGFRQAMDYYFVLLDLLESRDPLILQEIGKWIRALDMARFTSAVLWIMKNIFGMKDSELTILENGFQLGVDEDEGKFLLNEIICTGNMGHADIRYKRDNSTAFRRYIGNQRRNLHLLSHYPEEICWSPLFNIVRYFWQLTIKRKYEHPNI